MRRSRRPECESCLAASIPSAVTLPRLAEIMRRLGCHDALNLDGGALMAMYCRGRTIVPAGRRLTNILVAYEETAEQ